MLPDRDVVGGDELGVGLGVAPCTGDALPDGVHATSSTTATARKARLMNVKPRRGDRDSDVRPGLPAVDGDARTVEEAGLLRADERDHVRHLLHDAKSPERHLGAHERVDPFRVRLLPPIPAAALPPRAAPRAPPRRRRPRAWAASRLPGRAPARGRPRLPLWLGHGSGLKGV